jgi:RNA polymerase-binding transcription factor
MMIATRLARRRAPGVAKPLKMRSTLLLTPARPASHSRRMPELFRRGRTMSDHTTEGQLRRELDLILGRLERHERAALSEARSEGMRLVGDMFADAQVVASRNLDALSYERLSRRARELVNALERVRDGSYGTCEECGGSIPAARRRALPGVTTCVRCQELGESLRARPEPVESISRRPKVRGKNGHRDEAKT